MSDQLHCNVPKCNARLNDRAWVTRCLHVFCSEHGASYFHNSSDQVSCPICNEINVKSSDVSFCQTNPSDMILAGLRPEKILRIVDRTVKLWKCQLDADRRYDGAKIHMLTKQLDGNSRDIKETLHRKHVEHSGEVAALQANYNGLMIKLKQVQHELEMAKSTLRKYKAAYEALLVTNKRHPGDHRSSRNYLDLGVSPLHRAMPQDEPNICGLFGEDGLGSLPDF